MSPGEKLYRVLQSWGIGSANFWHQLTGELRAAYDCAADEIVREHRGTLDELLDWAEHMGGWDSECWRRAERLMGREEE